MNLCYSAGIFDSYSISIRLYPENIFLFLAGYAKRTYVLNVY